jgi:hypothetical protein
MGDGGAAPHGGVRGEVLSRDGETQEQREKRVKLVALLGERAAVVDRLAQIDREAATLLADLDLQASRAAGPRRTHDLSARIEAALRATGRSMRAYQIEKLIGVDRAKVANGLLILRNQGRAEALGKGLYRIKSEAPAAKAPAVEVAS